MERGAYAAFHGDSTFRHNLLNLEAGVGTADHEDRTDLEDFTEVNQLTP